MVLQLRTSILLLGCVLLAAPLYSQSGDTLRGAGTYLNGLGWYNLNTARANSVNVDAAIRWKNDLRKIQAAGRAKRMQETAGFKLKADEARQKQLEREQQLRSDPSSQDVHKGDALDVLLYDLSDPDITLEKWQAKPVSLPEKMSVKDIIFQFTPLSSSSQSPGALGSGVIALSRLDIQGRWPTALAAVGLDAERGSFEANYSQVRKEIVEGKLTVDSLLKMDDSLDKLKAKAVAEVPEARGYRKAAVEFVDDLKAATRMFDAATVEYAREILIDTLEHDAKTVGELVAFMQKYRLQFASAERHSAARELYSKLFEAMRKQADELGVAPITGNRPPDGFVSIFNGKDLTGWRESKRGHWNVRDGVLVYDGKGENLVSEAVFGDFELYIDWKIGPTGDSGIYLRGKPQVQIWDNAVGSGGLYNNKKGRNTPLAVADKPIGEWNTFFITMKGDRVSVLLNGQKVADNIVLENYPKYQGRIPPTGPLELQHHTSTLQFRNIFIKKL